MIYSSRRQSEYIPSKLKAKRYFGPAESIASLNLTNFEDADSLISAYKKKKYEMEKMMHEYYSLQHEYTIVSK
jgi:hypothetical protein